MYQLCEVDNKKKFVVYVKSYINKIKKAILRKNRLKQAVNLKMNKINKLFKRSKLTIQFLNKLIKIIIEHRLLLKLRKSFNKLRKISNRKG